MKKFCFLNYESSYRDLGITQEKIMIVFSDFKLSIFNKNSFKIKNEI